MPKVWPRGPEYESAWTGDPLTVKPFRAGPKAGEAGHEDTPGRCGDYLVRSPGMTRSGGPFQ